MGRGTRAFVVLRSRAMRLCFWHGDYQRNGGPFLSLLPKRGYGKRTAISEYPVHKRGGQGVFTITMTEKKVTGCLPRCWSSARDYDHVRGGRCNPRQGWRHSKLGRSTQGVKVMNLWYGRCFCSCSYGCQQKKAPKHAENQGMLDLMAAGARDAGRGRVC